MGRPATRNLEFVRGDTWAHEFTFTSDAAGTVPIVITGRTYTMQARSSWDASTPAVTFSCAVSGDGTAGTVVVSVDATTSALVTPGQYVYDLQESATGVLTTLVSGVLDVLGDVTR